MGLFRCLLAPGSFFLNCRPGLQFGLTPQTGSPLDYKARTPLETMLPCKARQPPGPLLQEQRRVCHLLGSCRSALPKLASFGRSILACITEGARALDQLAFSYLAVPWSRCWVNPLVDHLGRQLSGAYETDHAAGAVYCASGAHDPLSLTSV
jgi:hypothetical protein